MQLFNHLQPFCLIFKPILFSLLVFLGKAYVYFGRVRYEAAFKLYKSFDKIASLKITEKLKKYHFFRFPEAF